MWIVLLDLQTLQPVVDLCVCVLEMCDKTNGAECRVVRGIYAQRPNIGPPRRTYTLLLSARALPVQKTKIRITRGSGMWRGYDVTVGGRVHVR